MNTVPSEVAAHAPVDLGPGTVVLTGAGISTDSGIPDYRGPSAPERRPMTFGEFRASDASRQRYWARAYLGWQRMGVSQPNDAHYALARIAVRRGLGGLITQNVDGLHTAAGHPGVIDLHGRLNRVVCLDCGQRTSRDRLQQRLAELNPGFTAENVQLLPDGDVALDDTAGFSVAVCENCSGVLKPDVVFFGENAPRDRVQACRELVDAADSLLVLGSSLAVMSGLRFVKRARNQDMRVVIVNRGTTRGDDLADVKIDGGCAETLRQWLDPAEFASPSPR